MTSESLSLKKKLGLLVKFIFILIFLVFNIIVVFAYTWNLFSPVKKVNFLGYPVDKKAILKKIELEKKSILFLDTQDLEEKFTNPTTKIKLKKFLPYFINLSATKKEPLAYLQQGTRIFFLDSEKFPFAVSAFNNPTLPIIRFSQSFHKENQYLRIEDILTLDEVQKTLVLLKIFKTEQANFPEAIFSRNLLIEIENPLNIVWIISTNKNKGKNRDKLFVDLGYNFFELKIKTLGLIFTRLQENFSKVKKIDARYADKIIITYQ